MKKAKKGYIILALVLLGSLSVNAYCSPEWDEFLRHPNKEAFVVLENYIAISSQRCHSDITPIQKHRTQLFELTREGSPSAFCAALGTVGNPSEMAAVCYKDLLAIRQRLKHSEGFVLAQYQGAPVDAPQTARH